MTADPPRAVHYIALAAGALALGWAAILVRFSDAGPVATAFWRFFLALPALFIVLKMAEARGAVARPRGPWIVPALMGGVMLGADFAFWHYSIRFTTVANATLLATMATVFVTIFAWLIYGRRPRGDFLIGLSLAVAGAGGLIVLKAQGGVPPLNQPLGDLFGLGAALCYAGYFLYIARARTVADAFRVMLVSSASGAIVALVIAAALGEPLVPQSAGGWGAVIGLALLCQAFAQGSIAFALGKVDPAPAAVMQTLQPIATAVLGALLLSEPMGWDRIACAGLALAGVVAAQIAARKALRPAG